MPWLPAESEGFRKLYHLARNILVDEIIKCTCGEMLRARNLCWKERLRKDETGEHLYLWLYCHCHFCGYDYNHTKILSQSLKHKAMEYKV